MKKILNVKIHSIIENENKDKYKIFYTYNENDYIKIIEIDKTLNRNELLNYFLFNHIDLYKNIENENYYYYDNFINKIQYFKHMNFYNLFKYFHNNNDYNFKKFFNNLEKYILNNYEIKLIFHKNFKKLNENRKIDYDLFDEYYYLKI